SGKALGDLNSLAIDFLSKDFPKPQPPVPQISSAELEKFAGFYPARAPRHQLFAFLEARSDAKRVRVQKGQLATGGLVGPQKTILLFGKNLFRPEKAPEATIAFFPNSSGQMCLVASGEGNIEFSERINPIWPYFRLFL